MNTTVPNELHVAHFNTGIFYNFFFDRSLCHETMSNDRFQEVSYLLCSNGTIDCLLSSHR